MVSRQRTLRRAVGACKATWRSPRGTPPNLGLEWVFDDSDQFPVAKRAIFFMPLLTMGNASDSSVLRPGRGFPLPGRLGFWGYPQNPKSDLLAKCTFLAKSDISQMHFVTFPLCLGVKHRKNVPGHLFLAKPTPNWYSKIDPPMAPNNVLFSIPARGRFLTPAGRF
jgi:hypothetical protein